MSINRRLICLVLLSVFACAPALAIPVKDLYTAEVLVPANGNSGLTQNARTGLLQVLVRVSGSADVGKNPAITAALGHPSDYYYQYGYEASDRTVKVDGSDVPARLLRIAFEPSAIAKLLHSGGFPVWGSNRPTVLVWVAVSDDGGRRILTDTDKSSALQSLEDEAKRRGLPLLFPLLDLEDTSKVSTAEVWGLFDDQIDAASGRYNPDVVLAARIQQDATGQWTGSWSYRLDDKWQQMSDSGFSADDLIDDMIDRLADLLARRYAVGSTRGNMLLKVEGVNNLQDYAAVTNYLQSLTPVVDLSVVDISGNEALFRISSDGESRQLIEIINLDHNMVLLSPGSSGKPIQYRWVGR